MGRVAGVFVLLLLIAVACTPSHPVYCTPDETMCHGSCSALYKNPMNCGACDVACTQGRVCSTGTCATSCGGGTTQCGQSCVELLIDRDNCGACGVACTAGQVCTSGSCKSSCPSWQKLCGPYDALFCATTQSDNKNCGACGVSCGAKQACVNGACGSTCFDPQTLCTDVCADLQTDPTHCGYCTNSCTNNQICIKGACTCAASQSICSNVCVYLQTDTSNCGMCGHKCTNGTCGDGRCTTQLASTNNPVALALDAAHVFWAESSGALNQIDKGGTGLINLSTSAITTSIASDGTYVYWTNGAEVDFVSVDGGDASSQSLSVNATEIVADSSWVYVAHAGGIVRFPSGGGSASAIVSNELPHALTLHGSALYWANDAYQVRRAGIDGTGVATIATMTSAIGDVASDGTNVYFTWSSDILTAPIASFAPPLVLVSGLTGLWRIATDGSSVYWTDSTSISKVPIGGGATTLLGGTNGNASFVAVDGAAVYWTSSTAVTKISPK